MPADTPLLRAALKARSEPGGAVTLGHVAQRAGVSPSTVSRILNGSAKVSDEKRRAVEAAVAELGFRPNPVARGLAGGRTFSVGVVTQTISSPFYGEALFGIEKTLEQQGLVPLFVSGNWQESDESKAIATLLSRRVDGVIVLAGRLPDAALQAFSREVPMVVIGRRLQGPQLFSFGFDNRAGARLAVQHLIDQGHRRIAFMAGDMAHHDATERLEGYRDALERAGIAPNPQLIVQGDFTEPGGMQATARLLQREASFSALFASNDQMAIGAILSLHRAGLRVPDDVSVIGFDDVQAARYMLPPISTVHMSIFDIGRLAAEAMLSLLQGAMPAVAAPAPALVVRESTRRLAH
jgi:LacI family transcriptional regulator